MTDRILEMRRPPNDLNAPAVNFFSKKYKFKVESKNFVRDANKQAIILLQELIKFFEGEKRRQ